MPPPPPQWWGGSWRMGRGSWLMGPGGYKHSQYSILGGFTRLQHLSVTAEAGAPYENGWVASSDGLGTHVGHLCTMCAAMYQHYA
jgi:hypothetical protein